MAKTGPGQPTQFWKKVNSRRKTPYMNVSLESRVLISWSSHSWTKRPLYRCFLVIITVVFFSAMKNLLGLTLLNAYDIVKTNCNSDSFSHWRYCVVWALLKYSWFELHWSNWSSHSRTKHPLYRSNYWDSNTIGRQPSNNFNIVKFSFFI